MGAIGLFAPEIVGDAWFDPDMATNLAGVWDADVISAGGATDFALDSGAISATGADLLFQRTVQFPMDSGGADLTGASLAFDRGYVLQLDTGPVLLSGQDMIFDLGGSGHSAGLSVGSGTGEKIGPQIGP